MVDLPDGTVTFLLTDVAGSTALWELASEAMRQALARHDQLFEAVVIRHGGVAIRPRGEGDSRFAVFTSGPDALAAALTIQRTFAAEPWPTPTPIRVRIGLHTGEAELRDHDYYGTAVNRCARLRGIGHGGQTLLSEATAALVRDDLPQDVQLIDLGHHRLKDLTRPERVFQMTAADLPGLFPPLVSLDARPHNLPLQATPLLGREAELETVRTTVLCDDVRLITLTGPGGTGKTRLALQVAADLVDRFAGGVYFVDLAPVTEPARLAAAIAPVVGLNPGREPSLDDLKAYLSGRAMLLLLDNFEQLLVSAAAVAELLAACPMLTVLVTSRAPLQVRGEREIAVPPLKVPDVARLAPVEELRQYSAVALFLERAQAVHPAFGLTPENAQAVVTICARLDGLPLALELAAARIRVLTPVALAARLDHRLPLLTGGPRDLPARQRTLRDTIAWSYDLLEEPEQKAFRALSVFVGSISLEAAVAVLSGAAGVAEESGSPSANPPIDVLDAVSQLVARNLVRQLDQTSGEPRFGLLETIREFGLEQLEATGELADVRDRHLAWITDLAQRALVRKDTPSAMPLLNELEANQENIRAALSWGLMSRRTAEAGIQLALAASMRLWTLRGYLREGRDWLSQFLPFTEPGSHLRGVLLVRCGYLALRQNDFVAADQAFAEALEIWQALGDRRQISETLRHFGVVKHQLDEIPVAVAMLEECLRLSRDEGDRLGERVSLRNLADIHIDAGEYVHAITRYQESLAIARADDDGHDTAYALRGLGHIARLRGEYARAAHCLRESIVLLQGLRDRRCLPLSLEGLACIGTGSGWAERAARILGAVHAMQLETGAPSPPSAMADYERTIIDARNALGTERFMTAWAAGASLTLNELVDLALAAPIPDVEPSGARRPVYAQAATVQPAVPLSAREVEVVSLIAQGLSNRQIAAQLVLSVRTVERHIENVYNRLGITGKAGRAIVTAYALRHHLLDGVAIG